jgi:hypothetical protein
MLPAFYSNDDAREDIRLREGAIVARESLTTRLRECACQEIVSREANALTTNVPYLGRKKKKHTKETAATTFGGKKKKKVRETAATTFVKRTGAGSLSIGRTGISKAKVKYSKLDVLGNGGYTVGPISLGRDAMYTGRQY